MKKFRTQNCLTHVWLGHVIIVASVTSKANLIESHNSARASISLKRLGNLKELGEACNEDLVDLGRFEDQSR